MASTQTLTGAHAAEKGHAQPARLSRRYDQIGNWVNRQFQRDAFGKGLRLYTAASPARPTQGGRLACRRHRGRPPRPRARRADALLSAPRQEGRYLGLRAGRVLSGPVARRPDRQSERLTGAILDAEAPPLEGHEGTKRGAASSTVEPGVAWLPVTHRHSVAQPGSLTPSVGGTAGKGSGPWASQGLAASMCQPGERAG